MNVQMARSDIILRKMIFAEVSIRVLFLSFGNYDAESRPTVSKIRCERYNLFCESFEIQYKIRYLVLYYA